MLGGVEGDEALVDVEDGDVVEAKVLGLDVVLRPEEFDDAGRAEHLKHYN